VKAFVAVSATVVLYFLLSTLFGPVGVQSYEELSRYRDRLSQNVVALENRGNELEDEAEAYRSDPGRIAVEARAIGYFPPEAGLVRIQGFSPERRTIEAGRLIAQRPAPPDRLPLIRWIALGFGVAVYAALRFLLSD
jgi:hypothetical protein